MNEILTAYTGYANLINALASLFLGCLVLVKNPGSPAVRAFSVFCFSVAGWALPYSRWVTVTDYETSLFWDRALNVSSIFIPAAFTNFTFKFLEKKNALITAVNLTLCIFFTAFSFSPLFIQDVKPQLFYPYWPVPGPLYHAFLAYFVSNVLYAHYLLWRELIHSRGVRRSQIRFLFVGTLIAFASGSINFCLIYNIPIPPLLNPLIAVYVIAVGYAIVRYRLMGIRLTSADKERLKAMLAVSSSINHEIRNPLGFIRADARELLSQMDKINEGDLRSRVKTVLAEVEKNAGRVIEITRAMTRYAKPVKDKTEFEAIDIAACVRSVVEDVKKVIPDCKTLRVPIRIEKNTGKVFGDKVFIEESLRNFLDNAAFGIQSAGRKRGRIEVRVYDCGRKRIMMAVQDNGCGIPAQDLEKVFELGYSRREHDGFKHGAGLFLIKWYADQMRSELQIESIVGEGTTVSMSFRKV